MPTKQFLLRLDEQVIERLSEVANLYGATSANQVAGEVIQRYLDFWIETKKAEQAVFESQREQLGNTAIEPIHSGEAMAAIMQRMPETIDVQAIFGDAAEWQREQRKDRPLPGREED